jgi:hypothetical protein
MHGEKIGGSIFLIMSLIFSTLILIYIPPIVKAQTMPMVFIDPKETQTQINATFIVNVNVSDVYDLCSWQAYIYFSNQILEATGYNEGPFLSSHGSTLFSGNIDNGYDATHGEVWMYCLRTWTGTGVDGSGTLGTVTFRAKTGGTSPLNLTRTILGNSAAEPISHLRQDGVVIVGKHDVAIVSVAPNKAVVSTGYNMRINVTLENRGDYPETFNVTTYANMTTIQKQTLTLSNGSSTIKEFTWNTSGFVKGNYSISAYAWPVPGETNVADNNFTDGWVFISMVGDINADGKVDVKDVYATARAYGSRPGYPYWNANCDITDDDKVDVKDYYIVCKNYGKVDP